MYTEHGDLAIDGDNYKFWWVHRMQPKEAMREDSDIQNNEINLIFSFGNHQKLKTVMNILEIWVWSNGMRRRHGSIATS